jgi:gliding motility-associated-like protein
MKTQFILYLFLLPFWCLAQSKTVNIHSISTEREPSFGYTLDGTQMFASSRAKLLNTAYFGPAGVYNKIVMIHDGYISSNDLVEMTDTPTDNIFFFGQFNELDPALAAFTTDEIDSLYAWSRRGGKVILCAGQSGNFSPGGSIFSTSANLTWGFSWKASTPVVAIQNTIEGDGTDIFSGPFGLIGEVEQGGSAEGYFDNIPSNAIVFGRDHNGNPTLFMDCNTLDLIVADVDAYTQVGKVSQGPDINTNQDIFWTNTIVFMDRLQPPPVLTKNGNFLVLNAQYNGYNWFKDGKLLGSSASSTYEPIMSGEYQVEVKVNGGCILKSNPIKMTISQPVDSVPSADPVPPPLPVPPAECTVFVPTAFSPDANGTNDRACVYSACIRTMEFAVYDQWGEQIYFTTDKTKCWDGTYQGKELNDAVFAWTLNATLTSGERITKKGNISLIR